ncbi:MAG: aldose epimerase family protein, partial [Verrucomicrobiota bacterium]
GRYANRISGGGFSIDGQRYNLESVNKKTGIQIHGGKTGFQKQNWKIETDPTVAGLKHHPASITLRLQSLDGHEGFPGNVTVWVQYRVEAFRGPIINMMALSPPQGKLIMEFRAKTDAPTHINLTNHAYFNLSGEGDLTDHYLSIPTKVLEFDDRKIPTGKILTLAEAGFEQEFKLHPSKQTFIPLDHCFVCPPAGSETRTAALENHKTGIGMSVETTQPGIQIYTANHFKGDLFPKYGAICFETQHFPDSPNRPEFPSTLLRPNQWFGETTAFHFWNHQKVDF